MRKTSLVRIGNQTIEISNLDKVFYPKTNFTKGQLLDYYARIGDVMLPHIAQRALTMIRYPNGVEGPFFYEKECPSYRPKWMRTIPVARTADQGPIRYCSVDDKPALLWIANLACLEFHVLLSKKENIHCPTAIAFDFDPGEGMTLLDCAWAALEMRAMLEAMNLKSFAKTSGKKGIHVYVPLNDPQMTFEKTKAFAHDAALEMEKRFSNKVTSTMRKSLRDHKIFIDWSQNDEHKTTCAAYSLRVNSQPTVSTPVKWEELTAAIAKKDPARLSFTSDVVLQRVKKFGDLFAPVQKIKQKLPAFKSGVSISKSVPVPATLKTYREKRRFDITPEPQGGTPSVKGKMKFVIQKHAASHLHYDFRLEDKGVLLSWAVPKGPSTDPAVKRLAMHVEDHPLDYAGFEGTIPKGEYGGGTVMVWDQGTYVNLTNRQGRLIPLAAGMAKGHIDFWLQGKKLNGGWSLLRMQNPKQWLLVKMDDAGAHFPPDPVTTHLKSVLTKRSLDQIASDKKSKVWHSNRSAS